VREQPRLLQHEHGHRTYIGQRVVIAPRRQPLLRDRPPVLGPVTEGEQRLETAGRGTGSRDGQHLVGDRNGSSPSAASRPGTVTNVQ